MKLDIEDSSELLYWINSGSILYVVLCTFPDNFFNDKSVSVCVGRSSKSNNSVSTLHGGSRFVTRHGLRDTHE